MVMDFGDSNKMHWQIRRTYAFENLMRVTKSRSYSLLLCGLFYEAICFVLLCVILFLCFSVILGLQLPSLGKRELILVLFERLFDLYLFGFVGFLFHLVSGKGCGLWFWHSLDFSLTFFSLLTVLRRWSRCLSYSLLLCGLFYETICFVLPCVILFLCFSVLLAWGR